MLVFSTQLCELLPLSPSLCQSFFNAVFHNTVTVTIFTLMDDDKYWGQDHLHKFFDRKDDFFGHGWFKKKANGFSNITMSSPDYSRHYTVTELDKILLKFFLHLATRNLVIVSHRARLPKKKQIKEGDTQQDKNIRMTWPLWQTLEHKHIHMIKY